MKKATDVYAEFKALSKTEKREFLTMMFGKCYRGRQVNGNKASDLEAKLKTIHRYVLGIENNAMFTDEALTFYSLIGKMSDKKHQGRVRFAFDRVVKMLRHIQSIETEHIFLLEMLDVMLDVMREDR